MGGAPAADDDDDGELEDDDDEQQRRPVAPNYRRKEREEGEDESSEEEQEVQGAGRGRGEERGTTNETSASNRPPVTTKEKSEDEEEEGEINDGEKVKKAFIPRVLCKYYQRGKCSWGRGCKFLHPGVNDTGNYSFLEFQDPNAKVFQRNAPESAAAASAQHTSVDADMPTSGKILSL